MFTAKGKVNSWNKKNPPGSKVKVAKDNGEVLITTTRSKAQLLADKVPIIWLEGITGCYLLSRVKPIKEEKK